MNERPKLRLASLGKRRSSPLPTPIRAAALLLLALCAACQGSGKVRGPQRVPLSALDPELAELWRAYLTCAQNDDCKEFERRRELALAEESARRFLVDNLAHEMVAAFESAGRAGVLRSNARFDRAQFELERFGAEAVPLLIAMVTSGDDVVARLAGESLGRIGPPAGPPLLEALETGDLAARRRITDLLLRLPSLGSVDAFLVEALEREVAGERDLLARAQAILALGYRARLAGEQERAAEPLTALLLDPEPIFVARAAEALAEFGDPRHAEALIAARERASRGDDALLLQATGGALGSLAKRLGLDPDPAPRTSAEWRRLFASAREGSPANPGMP